MNKRVTGALIQLALLVVGVPVVYLVSLPLGLSARSLLPPIGLLAGLIIAGLIVKKTDQPVSGPLTGWVVFLTCVALALSI
ncbi:hypothetical protein Lesp02_76410 [Lentzea sp. NBRC 105346]|uniref:hypothetical protein n=1 Tax=Lentzea sp. NBRC 105346 TaxID=3032205 RepID=UPI0024A516EC|nr:hypothetical protein [Lentzea sp. NBRC 105346]GLZ35454.1 hypothetical protein Lesp02_76410 [Lentzea sp. NBRC 105346]